MPTIWPFKRRRSGLLKEKDPVLTRQQQHQESENAGVSATPPRTNTALEAQSSATASRSAGLSSSHGEQPQLTKMNSNRQKPSMSLGKENVPVPERRSSIEDNVTALPGSRRLDHSPHLRPVDSAHHAQIPYNFRDTSSHVGIQRYDSVDGKSTRSKTVRSRSSAYDNSSLGLLRRRSSRKTRDQQQLREEEIRAMSASTNIPKRPGDGPLRRDSKKLRSLGARGSTVSLPPDGSVHSTMSGLLSQRGWEVGFLDIFNPRPSVRLSGVPQGVASTGVLPTPPSPVPEEPNRWKLERAEKRPKDYYGERKQQIIGQEADDLDAAELRLLLERDKTRKERRRRNQQEKLERRLRDEALATSEALNEMVEARDLDVQLETPINSQARRQIPDPGVVTPPTAIHPALRSPSSLGLGIDGDRLVYGGPSTSSPHDSPQRNPFADPVSTRVESVNSHAHLGGFTPTTFSPVETPLEEEGFETPTEEPVYETARAIRLSSANTPPLSPAVYGSMRSRPIAADVLGTNSLETVSATTERRSSDSRVPRAGGWSSFFRRSTHSRPGDSSPAGGSFSNTSRESMRYQPLPAHLVDSGLQQTARRTRSGTPVRTMSKFREDLPEMPLSPPESRTQSPDVTTAAALAATRRRANRSNRAREASLDAADAEPVALGPRYDTPVSPEPGARPQMPPSLASVDSEGSWLASGSMKRKSTQSAVTRSYGSLRKRNPEFAASYEELGPVDKDAEYVAGTGAHATTSDRDDVHDVSALVDAMSGEPVTMHDSVRRKPTVVRRELRVQSREGLLQERPNNDEETASSSTPDEYNKEFFHEPDSPSIQLQKATSVNFGKGHAKRVSAGSARMLDIMKPSSPTLGNFREQSSSPTTATFPGS